MKAKEITKTIVNRGTCNFYYVIHWMDEVGNRHSEYPSSKVAWDERAAELGWKGK